MHRGRSRKRKRVYKGKIENPAIGRFRQTLTDQIEDTSIYRNVTDFVTVLGYIPVSICLVGKGTPYYSVAAFDIEHATNVLLNIALGKSGLLYTKETTSSKHISTTQEQLYHLQFFHMYKTGNPLILPPLYMYGIPKTLNNLKIYAPRSIKKLLDN